MAAADFAASTDWHRVGSGLSVRFFGHSGRIVAQWLPRKPTSQELAIVAPLLTALKDQFAAYAKTKTRGALSRPWSGPLSDDGPWQSLELVGGVLMLSTDSGARMVGPRDLAKVVELLPDLLLKQEAKAATWQQRRSPKAGRT